VASVPGSSKLHPFNKNAPLIVSAEMSAIYVFFFMFLIPLFVVCNFLINVFVTAYSMIQKCEYFKNFL